MYKVAVSLGIYIFFYDVRLFNNIYTLLVQTFAGRKFRKEKKREILGINFRECPITTHFA